MNDELHSLTLSNFSALIQYKFSKKVDNIVNKKSEGGSEGCNN